jgi:hypothetical protein
VDTTRRQFLDVLLGVAGVGALASACGGDDGGPDGGSCMANGRIEMNHTPGHVLTIPAADVAAQVDRAYDIMGGATHNHQVFVTAMMFRTIGGGTEVTTSTSAGSVDGHTHTVRIRCA